MRKLRNPSGQPRSPQRDGAKGLDGSKRSSTFTRPSSLSPIVCAPLPPGWTKAARRTSPGPGFARIVRGPARVPRCRRKARAASWSPPPGSRATSTSPAAPSSALALESELPSARTTDSRPPAAQGDELPSPSSGVRPPTGSRRCSTSARRPKPSRTCSASSSASWTRAGRPQAAWKRIHTLRDEQRVLTLAPTRARFQTLVIDPPWSEDNISASGGHDYALMSFEDIAKLPVQDWAEENCHLWLWITNNIVPLASSLIATWGVRAQDDAHLGQGDGRPHPERP